MEEEGELLMIIIFTIKIEAAVGRCSTKEMFLKIRLESFLGLKVLSFITKKLHHRRFPANLRNFKKKLSDDCFFQDSIIQS